MDPLRFTTCRDDFEMHRERELIRPHTSLCSRAPIQAGVGIADSIVKANLDPVCIVRGADDVEKK